MSENRLPDYLDHIQQAATDACSFVEGLAKDDFLADKRTQQAVIMSLIVIGEAATKVIRADDPRGRRSPAGSQRPQRQVVHTHEEVMQAMQERIDRARDKPC